MLSEHWARAQLFCPSCGNHSVSRHANNRPVADFFCLNCREEYELKSGKSRFSEKVADGAYATMIERLSANDNPNLVLLRYDLRQLAVRDLLVVPKQFFTPEIIERRKPLSSTARRAGWVGCNILLQSIPPSGRIDLVRDGVIAPKADVLASWRATLFLREKKDVGARGWLLSVMRCVEHVGGRTFSLEDVYSFESELKRQYPANQHIRAKMRQQMQFLRDRGYLTFLGQGNYQLSR